ncbi:hypothetical protein Goklo_024534 [Gossypium klotzschianum]|uniref:MULE transposase domain-containing protein n=1 Tax=Gossypium klotzschianum TaxID=34286 RepID=A0A7J8W8J9_9ROSI|nr:hypothetical protein [Gossypium klotzschianum]
MSIEEEYYINLCVGGKFICDPHVRYLGGEMNDSSIIDMINYWVKLKEIDLYVEHEIDTVVFVDDESMLVVACLQFGGDGNEGGEGGKVVGNKCGEGEGESGEVVGSKGGESDGGGEERDRDESDSVSEDENTYLMKVMYLSDGDNDDELQEGRQKVREMEGKTSGKGKETVLDEAESESFGEKFKAGVPKEVDGEGLNDSVGKEEDGNKTEYFDSDDYGSILGSEDDDNTNICRRRSKFPTYNPNLASPHFCIGMLFKDVKSFPDEHKCCVSFRNKMVNVKVIAEHFEATIGDHLKMKPREIKRRVASKMHVNANMIKCRKAKKMIKDKLAGNFLQEFAMLWDYANELRLKNPGSTIKIAVNRVTPHSPTNFKRFYVCFEALKRGWKEGCRPVLGLDGCFLKGPFKCKLLAVVGRDGNNQMYLVAWAIVERECIDYWE